MTDLGDYDSTIRDDNTMMETDDCDQLSDVSSYSSTGQIECSLVKIYNSTSDDTKNMTFHSPKAFPKVQLNGKEQEEIQNIISGKSPSTIDERIFPKISRVHIEKTWPCLLQNLKALTKSGWIYVSSALTNDMTMKRGDVVKRPPHVYGDVCIFSPTEPVRVLTFLDATSGRDISERYNSQVAKLLFETLSTDRRRTVSGVHGVFDEDVFTSDNFWKRYNKMETDTRKIALPRTLDMNKKRYKEISNIFLKALQEPERKGTASTSNSRKNSLKLMHDERLKIPSEEEVSPYSSFSRDSGCPDTHETMKLKHELETMKNENKVLTWKLKHVDTHKECTSQDLEMDLACDEDVTDEAEMTSHSNETTNKVFHYVFKSMEQDFMELLDMEIVSGFLHINGLLKGDVMVIEGSVRRDKKEMFLIIEDKDLIERFFQFLEQKGTSQILMGKVRDQVQALHQMPLLIQRSDRQYTSGRESSNLMECPLLKQPGKVDIMDKKMKCLKKLLFHQNVLLNNGELEQFHCWQCKIKEKFQQDCDVMFYLLESQTIRRRMFYENEFDQTELLQQMEELIPSMSHPQVGTMMMLVRKGTALAMKGELQQGLDLVTEARGMMDQIEPCMDTGMVMYALVNMLLQQYEADPSQTNKEHVIRSIREAVMVHISQAQPEIRDEFSRVLYLKMIFCHLGISVFGKLIECPVDVDDLRAADACFQLIGTFPGTFVNRRSMFYSMAKAVLHYHRKHASAALKCAEDSKRLAILCGFRKELGYIEKFISDLREACSLKDTIQELETTFADLETILSPGTDRL